MPARPEQSSSDSRGLLPWLAYELAPREGRGWAVAQMAIACAITVAIAMVFRIPEPTYMAYIVFLISKDEKASTFVSAIGGLTAVTIAIAATLGLSLIDLSEPALRLPAMAAITFLAMYSIRVLTLGPITYLAGFVIVLLQSVVDDVPSPELLTRITLWIWVVLFVPIVTTVLLNLLFGQSVEALREREFKRIVNEISRGMREARPEMPLSWFRERVAGLLDKKSHEGTDAPNRAAVTDGVLRSLLDLLVVLESASSSDFQARGNAWAAKLDEIRDQAGQPFVASRLAADGALPSTARPIEQATESALQELYRAIAEPQPKSPKVAAEKRELVAKDAATNAAHWQFALKTAFAVMIVYGAYTLLDWPGLRTSIVTCFFVALGSLGETVHKLTLRISGALIGGALAAVCIVFVLPHCTDIGQLCLLIAIVSAGAAWVATSSERLAYAGMQIAFAFFLGVLQDYAPATDLTVLRDRIAGILLGNIVMTLVFSTLWPESAATRVRSAVGQALRAMASLIQSPEGASANREKAARALVLAEHYRTLRGFELELISGHASVAHINSSLRDLAALESRIFMSSYPAVFPEFREEDRQALSAWAREAARAAESAQPWPMLQILAAGHSESVGDVLDAIQHISKGYESSGSERGRTSSATA